MKKSLRELREVGLIATSTVIVVFLVCAAGWGVYWGYCFIEGCSTVYLEDVDRGCTDAPSTFRLPDGTRLFDGADTYGKRLDVCLAKPEIHAEYGHILEKPPLKYGSYRQVRNAYIALMEKRCGPHKSRWPLEGQPFLASMFWIGWLWMATFTLFNGVSVETGWISDLEGQNTGWVLSVGGFIPAVLAFGVIPLVLCATMR